MKKLQHTCAFFIHASQLALSLSPCVRACASVSSLSTASDESSLAYLIQSCKDGILSIERVFPKEQIKDAVLLMHATLPIRIPEHTHTQTHRAPFNTYLDTFSLSLSFSLLLCLCETYAIVS